MNAPASPPPPSALRKTLYAISLLGESKIGMIGGALCLFWILVAVFAPWLAPFGPTEQIQPLQNTGAVAPDGQVFWLGTDNLGRDVLSRIIYGSRTVLLWAPLATACAYVVGIVMGLAAGYLGGIIDEFLSFTANLILSFPVLVLYILIISIIGASSINIVIAVTFASSPAIFRIVRGEVLSIRPRDFVAASQTRGENAFYIMFFEILPNAKGPLIVDSCLRLGYTTITIGILGFLGLGFPPPTPDWGGMVNDGRVMALTFPHMVIYPCLAISSFVLGLNLLADGLREISLTD